MPHNERTYEEVVEAYKKIKKENDKFGKLRKTIFHVHTPASYDYRLFKDLSEKDYKKLSEEELENIVYEKEIIPLYNGHKLDVFGPEFDIFKDKKEKYAFLLLAHELLINEYEIVVVTDHNTFDGVEKLRLCVKHLKTFVSKYPVDINIFCGIEISCADKLHVVSIIDDNTQLNNEIIEWVKEHSLSEMDGVYLTSLDVMDYFSSKGAISYIAHIYSSNINKGTFFSNAYRKRLFKSGYTNVVGVKEKEQINKTKNILRSYKTNINFLIDNDSHDIDALSYNYFWIKGSKINFQMLKEALIDFDISVYYENNCNNNTYLAGLYIMYEDGGFLRSKEADRGLVVKFSDSLNCLIGGRGTGKSTILEIVDFIMTQNIESEDLLDFICTHGNVYLLFVDGSKEYIVEFLNPDKKDKESILTCFERERPDTYGRKYSFNKNDIRKFMLRKYLEVYEIECLDINTMTNSNIKRLSTKSGTLYKLYDDRYSVNDLVRYASGDEISKFIYELLFDNLDINSLDSEVRFKSISGLKNFLKKTEEILENRRKEIDKIISPFNSSQKDILNIDYTQRELCDEYPICEIYREKINNISKNYNISKDNLIDFIYSIINKKGVVNFLKASIDNDLSWIEPRELLKFTNKNTFKNIDNDKRIIDESSAQNIVSDIILCATNAENIYLWNSYFKQSFCDLEQFNLLFNINSKEDDRTLGSNFKNIKNLSLGQKVVAMLDLILGFGKYSGDSRPIIIDQPEDNLDSRYIYKNLVHQLRSTKDKRQVIIATHNATIVTNAMADSVIVMESDGENGWVKRQGYPGEFAIKKEIINHMEGGIESFKHKELIYKEVIQGKKHGGSL